ncbi:septum formation initiator [Enterococcus sp. JM4C]|uniref:FtsB family cell division protein n=1 Tax=Candidatus Enterococcus huntleyi TaxID=1857217 RepID=UPI001379FFB9|nr:septum formation initiator family protein [Enterococcus sp. JM4C]KAF1295262.1 septum formation initiator [Enterococcus sp. JM4C]
MSQDQKNKISTIDTAYAKEQYSEFQKQQKQLVFRRRRLAVVFMVAIGVFVIIGVQLFSDYQRLQSLGEIKKETVAESAQVDKQLSTLKQDVNLLKDDEYVAKVARSRFFYSKEGEQVYPVLGTDTSDAADQAIKNTTESSATDK